MGSRFYDEGTAKEAKQLSGLSRNVESEWQFAESHRSKFGFPWHQPRDSETSGGMREATGAWKIWSILACHGQGVLCRIGVGQHARDSMEPGTAGAAS